MRTASSALALTWAGAKLWGIKGVAAASALRLAAFSVFLLAASFAAGRVRFPYVWKKGLGRTLAALALFAAGLAANGVLGSGLWGAGVLILGFAAAAYFGVLDAEERAFLAGVLRLRRGAVPAGAEAANIPGAHETEGRG